MSDVHHQSLARYLTEMNLLQVFFYYNSLLQPDKHTVGVFTCTKKRASCHLALTVAFHEPMMSAFNLPSCVLSIRLLYCTWYVTHLHPMVNSKPILHTCMNKPDFFDWGSAGFSRIRGATDMRHIGIFVMVGVVRKKKKKEIF